VYAVITYAVTQRRLEIGVRLAVGAAPNDVIRLFMREIRVVVVYGLGSGVVCALISSRVIRSLVFGVSPIDAATYTVVIAMLVVVSMLATWIPARRASRIDLAHVLRGG
jgi:putative ABC transport system permease protein